MINRKEHKERKECQGYSDIFSVVFAIFVV